MRVRTFPVAAGLVWLASACPADIDPLSGIDFVTVGAAGNAPWTGGGSANGRGQVNYQYRIGKYEVTTAQWAEFMNAAFDRPAGDAIPWVQTPFIWGASGTTPNNSANPNARHWTVPAGNEMRATGGISWRTAAIYCNWLCNGKATNREAFLTGAYDVSTFASIGGRYLDQLAHTPGAAYYIPTWDEWIKAAHYDPSKSNPDGTTGGYWTYSNSSDSPLIAGPPDIGTANYGFTSPSPYSIMLGSYNVQSPWGLYDAAGFTGEWTEEALYGVPGDPPTDRLYEGSQWGFEAVFADMVRSPGGGDFPGLSGSWVGFRIASIPSPAVWSVVAGFLIHSTLRRRRRHEKDFDSGGRRAVAVRGGCARDRKGPGDEP